MWSNWTKKELERVHLGPRTAPVRVLWCSASEGRYEGTLPLCLTVQNGKGLRRTINSPTQCPCHTDSVLLVANWVRAKSHLETRVLAEQTSSSRQHFSPVFLMLVLECFCLRSLTPFLECSNNSKLFCMLSWNSSFCSAPPPIYPSLIVLANDKRAFPVFGNGHLNSPTSSLHQASSFPYVPHWE